MTIKLPHIPISRSECLDVLGLNDDAAAEEIRRAYRKLVLELHPDRAENPDASRDAFLRVVEAYKKLKALQVMADTRPEAIPPHEIRYHTQPVHVQRRGGLEWLIILCAAAACVLVGTFSYTNVEEKLQQQYLYSRRMGDPHYMPREVRSEITAQALGSALGLASIPGVVGIGGWYIVQRLHKSHRLRCIRNQVNELE